MSKAAAYEKAKRERLKAAGLVKAEFWITPENKEALKNVEHLMRKHTASVSMVGSEKQNLKVTLMMGDNNG